MDKIQLTDVDRRSLIDTAFRGGLAVALYAAFPAFSDIYRLWERDAGLNSEWTQIPFEYPPISALYFEPFTYLPSSTWAVVVNGLIMATAAVAVTWVLIRAAKSSAQVDVDIQLWVASPALLLFLPINWDVLVVLVAILGVVALNQSRPAGAGVWHGIGTAFKIFPGAVVLPVLPVVEGWRRRIMFLATGLAALGASYLAYWSIEPEDWRFHLDFASLRTDIDSTVWGVLERLLEVFGMGLSIDVVNLVSTLSMVVALSAVTLWAAKVKPTVAELAAVAIITLLIFNKVFKPQYVLWVIPFIAWVRADRIKMRVVEAMTIVQFAVAYFALPTLIHPFHTIVRVSALAWMAADIVRASSFTRTR